MICSHCGTNFDSKFCPECGAEAPTDPQPSSRTTAFPWKQGLSWCLCVLAVLFVIVGAAVVAGALSATSLSNVEKTSLFLFYVLCSICFCVWLFRKTRMRWKKDSWQRHLCQLLAGVWGLICLGAAMTIEENKAATALFLMYLVPLLYRLLRKGIDPTYGQEIPSAPWRFVHRWRKRRAQHRQALREAEAARIAYNKAHGIRMCPRCHSENVVCLGRGTRWQPTYFWGNSSFHWSTTVVESLDKTWRCRQCRYRWEE